MHGETVHGWLVDTQYKEVIATLAHSPYHDRSSWADNEPGTEEAETLCDDCIKALKTIIFLKGLTDAYTEYNDQLANAFVKNSDTYPKR